MPSSKLLKERIESIQDTMKITNAMYLISSSKLRKARKNYQNVSPYFNRMRDTISRVGAPPAGRAGASVLPRAQYRKPQAGLHCTDGR